MSPAPVKHEHDYPSAGVIFDALRTAQSGNRHNADLILQPWQCCPTGTMKLLAAHLQLARAIAGEYVAVALSVRADALPSDMPADARASWAQAYAIADAFLAGEQEGARALVGFLAASHDEHAAMLFDVAVRVVAQLIDTAPGLATTRDTLADG